MGTSFRPGVMDGNKASSVNQAGKWGKGKLGAGMWSRASVAQTFLSVRLYRTLKALTS